MIIIETENEYSNFISRWNSEVSIVVPIWVDPFLRPEYTRLSFLYVRFRNEDFILPIEHTDCVNFKYDVEALSQSIQTKIIWDKKGFLQSEWGDRLQNITDLQSQSFFTKNEFLDFEESFKELCSFYIRLGSERDLGKIVPIVKWISVLQRMTSKIPFDTEPIWIDKNMIPILSEMEKMGIPVDGEKFLDKWPSHKHLLKQTRTGIRVYSEYNPYTVTSRPTNRHSGINWGALNKEDGTRQIIKAGDGKELYMLDYDAFHPRLIGKLLNIPLPTASVHQTFADEWGIPYADAKSRVFRILYGGVRDEDTGIPFFKAVRDALEMWGDVWTRRGYIQTAAGRIIRNEWIPEWTPIKGFNYLLQAVETEFNMQTLSRIMDEKLPIPIMYSYDSFMWELDAGDTVTAHNLRKIVDGLGIPTKASWGMTYDDL
jgi:hypothetical protein